MNNFYQFGDKVSKVGKPSIGVVIRDENAKYSNKITHYFVLFENGDTGRFAADELKPVPHPDTARLDWLEKQRAAAGVWASSKVSITADGVQVETPTLRQSIDAAMHKSD